MSKTLEQLANEYADCKLIGSSRLLRITKDNMRKLITEAYEQGWIDRDTRDLDKAMKNYRKDCIYFFRTDSTCGRLIESHKRVVSCDHICDCPWFRPEPKADCIYIGEGGNCTKGLPGTECDITKCTCYTKKGGSE